MTAAGNVLITASGGLAMLRLSNPARRNAISVTMWRQIAAFAAEVGSKGEVRAVIIRGDGDLAFSAGADISGFDAARSDGGRGYDDLVEDACLAVEAIPQPTIAVIRGPCMGAGCSLAGSCDLRIAADDAFFAVPAARLGLGYDPRQIRRLLRAFGPGAVRQLLLTADRFPAARAYGLGAVHVYAPAAAVEEIAQEMVRRIAANAPLTMKAAKLAIRALTAGDGSDLYAEAERLYAAADASADYAEGRRAFTEKRPPRFQGK
jgi:enoyl-CoA hydratase/carnithine racemase